MKNRGIVRLWEKPAKISTLSALKKIAFCAVLISTATAYAESCPDASALELVAQQKNPYGMPDYKYIAVNGWSSSPFISVGFIQARYLKKFTGATLSTKANTNGQSSRQLESCNYLLTSKDSFYPEYERGTINLKPRPHKDAVVTERSDWRETNTTTTTTTTKTPTSESTSTSTSTIFDCTSDQPSSCTFKLED